jgi:hypothetical protein
LCSRPFVRLLPRHRQHDFGGFRIERLSDVEDRHRKAALKQRVRHGDRVRPAADDNPKLGQILP